MGVGVSYGSYGSQVNKHTYRAYKSVWKKISKNPKRIEGLESMTGLDINVGLERIILKLPVGYTVDKAVHKKLDSPNTIGQQELFIITIKEHGWPT